MKNKIVKLITNKKPVMISDKSGYSYTRESTEDGLYKEVMIMWEDAMIHYGKKTEEEAKSIKTMTFNRLGYLLVENDKVVIIATQICPTTNTFRDVFAVPKMNVSDIVYLDKRSK